MATRAEKLLALNASFQARNNVNVNAAIANENVLAAIANENVVKVLKTGKGPEIMSNPDALVETGVVDILKNPTSISSLNKANMNKVLLDGDFTDAITGGVSDANFISTLKHPDVLALLKSQSGQKALITENIAKALEQPKTKDVISEIIKKKNFDSLEFIKASGNLTSILQKEGFKEDDDLNCPTMPNGYKTSEMPFWQEFEDRALKDFEVCAFPV
jgi:hypothetical protein